MCAYGNAVPYTLDHSLCYEFVRLCNTTWRQLITLHLPRYISREKYIWILVQCVCVRPIGV